MNKPKSFGRMAFLAAIQGVALFAAAVALCGCETESSRNRKRATPNPPPPVAINAAAPEAGSGWRSLFDGKTLAGWAVTDFAGHGDVKVGGGKILLETGAMTGIHWTNEAALLKINYEIALDAMRTEGNDFFCGLTFPVKEDPCSLIVGGWGGGVVGLSSLDGQDAANNETTRYMNFDNGRWYAIRVRVTETNISCWIDADKVVDADTRDRGIGIRPEVESSRPLGVATWSTGAALKNIRTRKL